MSEPLPYYYRAYGLNIVSEIPVTGFQVVEKILPPDVTIKEGVVPDQIDPVINEGVLFQSNDHEYLLKVDTVASYYVKNGNEITVQMNKDCSIHEVSAFLIGSAFGAVIHQRRLLPLHASTVVYKNKCLVFMGISGAGKTTLAAALIRKGALFVADDISVIDFSGRRPAVIPAFPSIKIWKDSLKHLQIENSGLHKVRDELEKYYLPVENYVNSSQRVDMLFALSTHNKNELVINAVEGIDKFQLVKRHTYLFRGIPKTGLEINHFEQVTRLIRDIHLYRVIKPDTGFDTDAIIGAISGMLHE